MRNEIRAYLSKRPNAEVLVLTFVAVLGFCILLVRPYRINDWLEQNERWLLWAEVILLLVILAILLHYISSMRQQMEQMKKQQGITSAPAVQMYHFYDERGDLKLSVKSDYLYYLEAADNYVKIYYLHGGKLQNLLIRNSLKNIEWRYKDTKLKRCHRSYLINLDKVQMVKRIDGDVYMDFNESKVKPVPLSKAYADPLMEYFAQ